MKAILPSRVLEYKAFLLSPRRLPPRKVVGHANVVAQECRYRLNLYLGWFAFFESQQGAWEFPIVRNCRNEMLGGNLNRASGNPQDVVW